MFAAILNSFFIVLLPMVFVQKNFVEINIYHLRDKEKLSSYLKSAS
jgi:hypothetical protein